MQYKDLNLKMKDQMKTISIQGKEIHILQYLPVMQKNDLVQIALQQAKENGVINQIKLDILFNMYIVLMYTDLIFTEEERADLAQLYDELQSTGILNRILGAMDEKEYESLYGYLEAMRENQEKYERSFSGTARILIQDLPKHAEEAADILKDIDLDKYKQVKAFAEAANGDRPIPAIVEN